tara:strand:+ start:2046 stop:2357 length:312 start_codon:yes stop_codon:yes gene_type:complete
MNTKQTQTIQLLNQTYQIKCPEQEVQALKMASEKINALMWDYKNQFKTIDDHQALLLAALKISHELLDVQNNQASRQQQLSQFINTLEEKVNQVSKQCDKTDA